MASSLFTESLKSQYMMMDIIGRGKYSLVKLAKHRLTGMLVAVKVQKNVEHFLYHSLSEMTIMEELRHENIIKLFQVMVTTDHFYLIMEHAEKGDLMKRVREAGRLPDEEVRRLFRQVANAIQYCHQRGIVHRDLKPQNVLIDGEDNAKVCDFGFSTKCDPGRWLQKRCGTYFYNAPELFCRGPYDGMKVDVWSMGVMLYVMLTGQYPFKGATVQELYQQVSQGRYEIPNFMSKDVQDLTSRLLTVDAEKRPTLSEILKHPWLTRGDELPASIPREVDYDHPNPNILAVMSFMGYDSDKLCQSLKKKEYDEPMATYLMLEQLAEGLGHEVPTMSRNPGVTPCPTPDEHFSLHSVIKRTGSLSGLNVITLSWQHLMAAEEMPTRDKVSRIKSMPSIAIHCADNITPSKTLAKQSGPVAAPAESCTGVPEEMHPSTKSNLILSAAMPPNATPHQTLVGRKIRAFLMLCCCLPGHKP